MKADKRFLVLLLAACLMLLPFLGLTDYHTKGEPRESIVAYSMLESGNWILPENNGGDMAYKPPFFHWMITLFSVVGGAVSEYSSRLPSAVAVASFSAGTRAARASRISKITIFSCQATTAARPGPSRSL